MSEKGQLDSDKLPWLEPYREPGAPRAKAPSPRLREVKLPPPPAPASPKRRRVIGSSLGASLGLLAAAALAFGGYYFGRQSVTDAPGAAEAIVTPLPPVGSERTVLTYPEIEDGDPVAAVDPVIADEVAPSPPVITPAPRRDPVVRPARTTPPQPPVAAPPPPKTRVAAAAPAPTATVPAPRPRVVSAPPPRPLGKPGTNLLLGYYATPRYADQARSRVIARYPYLAGLPVQVAAIPLGQGRGAMYALRLVARSKSDARALCKNLKGIGYGCTVH